MSTFTFVPRHPPRRTKVKRSYACAGKDDHFPTLQEGKAQKEGIITSTQRNGTLSGKLYKAIQRERNARRKEKKSQRLAADEIESNKNKGYDTVEGVGASHSCEIGGGARGVGGGGRGGGSKGGLRVRTPPPPTASAGPSLVRRGT